MKRHESKPRHSAPAGNDEPDAARPSEGSEGQAWIVEYLCELRPWLRKATWEDMCAKMRDHAPDIYSLLSARGKTPNGKHSDGANVD
jgi:hypothetical protein